MSTVTIGDFEGITSTTSQQYYGNQAQGNWFFAGTNQAGVAHAANTSGNTAPSGTHCAILQTSTTTPVSYAYTVLTGLTVGQSYTVDFLGAMRSDQSTADVFHANVYDGTTTSVIWNNRIATQWASTNTCTAFTATQSAMMLLFIARLDNATVTSNPSVLFDRVRITPGEGVAIASTGVTFAAGAIQRPASIVTSSVIGDFEGIHRDTGLRFYTGFGDNWYHYTGFARVADEVQGGTIVSGPYCAFIWATHTRNNAYMYTVLQNLNTSTTYTVTFRTILRSGYSNVTLFACNVWDGTSAPVTINNSTVTSTWTQRSGTFTPTASTMMLAFTTYTPDTNIQQQCMVDDVNISPWQGLNRTSGAITYTPVASRNTLSAFSPASAPQNLVGRAGTFYMTFTWDAPASNGGSPINYYVLTYTAGGTTTHVYNQVQAPTTHFLASSGILNNLTYTVTVCALTSAGPGQAATISLTTTTAAPTASSPTLTSSVLGDFEAVTNTTSNTAVNGAADNWFFSPSAGASLSMSIGGRKAPSGFYALHLSPSSSQPIQYAYTMISGMSTSTAYTMSLHRALVPESRGVDFLTVSVYDGASSVVIHQARPTSIGWEQVTCAPFTPSRSIVMLVITAHNGGTISNTSVLVDNVQITPFAGLSRSSTGFPYVPAASPTPSWALTTSMFGNFEGIITNIGDTYIELNNATSDNWYMGNRSGVSNAASTGGTATGLYSLWLWAHSGNGNHMRAQNAYTILTGLSTSTAYTITYLRASRSGLGSQTVGMLITVNVFDGTNVTTISTGSTLAETWAPITCSAFTPAASTVMIIVTAVSLTANLDCQVMFDAFTITPFTNISKSLTGLTFVPSLGRNMLSSQGASAPTITSFSSTANSITINWSAPSNNGGSALVFYGIMMTRTNNVAAPILRYTNDASTFTWTESGLTAGVGYTFRVCAFNAAGASEISNTAALTIPLAVTGLSVVAGPASALLTWGNNNVGTVSYNVQYVVGGNTTTITDVTNTFAYFTGLAVGQVHAFSVAVVTGLSTTSFSSAVNATPLAALDALTSSLYSGFNNLNNTSTETGLTGVVGEWRFETAGGGVVNTSRISTQSGFEGSHVGYLAGNNQYMTTCLTGLSVGTSYTLTFTAARRRNTVFADLLYVNAYNGTTSTTIFSGRPAIPTFTTCTCSSFVATSPFMMIVFYSTNQWVLLDEVRLSPFAGVTPSPISPFPTALAALTAPTAIPSELIGSFDGLSSAESSFFGIDGTGDNWRFSTTAGGVTSPVAGNPEGTMVCFLDNLFSPSVFTNPYIFTILGNMSTATTYTVTFSVSSSGVLPDEFFVNTYDGVTVTSIHSGLPPSTSGWSQRTFSFTPSASTMMLLFTTNKTAAPAGRLLLDNIRITPFAGLTRSSTGIPYVAAASQFVISGLPGAPANLAATSRVGAIDLTWSAPTDTGLSAITSYRISITGGMTQTITGVTGTSRSVTGLSTGVSYTFAVSAVNTQGIGQPTSVTRTPATPSSAVAGNTTASVSTLLQTWTASAGETSLGYVVYRDNVQVGNVAANARSFTHTGLVAATSYTLGVADISVIGVGTRANTVTATLANPPVWATTLVSGVSAITAAWSPPSTGGDAVTSYNVYVDGVAAGSTASNTLVVSNLVAATAYTLGVSAVTAGGEGIRANRSGVTRPNAPRIDTALAATSAGITASWLPPAVGGNQIIGYRVFVNGNQSGATVLPPSGSAVISSLAPATTYTVSVLALTSGGEGARANTTAVTRPGIPIVNTSLVADASAISVAWSPPAGGGNAISGYNVYLEGAQFGATLGSNVNVRLVSGLESATSYTVGVAALTAAGEGVRANRVAATLPGAPGNVRVDGNIGFRHIPVSWDPPATGGNVRSGYFVRGNGGVLLATTLSGTSTFANITNLSGNTSYALQVQAFNASGTGALSTPAVVANTATVNPDLYDFIQANVLAEPPVRPNTTSSRFTVMDAVRAERAFTANVAASVVANTAGGAVSSASEILRESGNVLFSAMRGMSSTQSNRRRVLNTITRI